MMGATRLPTLAPRPKLLDTASHSHRPRLALQRAGAPAPGASRDDPLAEPGSPALPSELPKTALRISWLLSDAAWSRLPWTGRRF